MATDTTEQLQAAQAATDWLREGRRVARGVLVRIYGSAPFDTGDLMFLDADGNVAGDVSRGCVDADVARDALAVVAGGGPARVVDYDVSDEAASAAGLRCGGRIGVLVSEVTDATLAVELRATRAIADGTPHAVARVLDGPGAGACLYVDGDGEAGTLGAAALDAEVVAAARELIDRARSEVRDFGGEEASLPVSIAVRAKPAQLVILGAIDYAFEVADLASRLGYAVTIADPRRTFRPTDRFSAVATAVAEHPAAVLDGMTLGPRDAVLVFTHDVELDVAGVRSALAQPTGYIGALGSRGTTARRAARLAQEGIPEAELARLHAPCGLDIGAASPGEAAVSIVAEMIATRRERAGRPLREHDGPILPKDR